MRKAAIAILALLVVSGAIAQEKLEIQTLFTNSVGANSSSATWIISGTNADTSAVFRLRPYMSIQYRFNDGAGAEDSMVVSLTMQTTLTTSNDSSWVTSTVIEDTLSSYGWQAVQSLSCPPAAYGRIIVKGLAGNSARTATADATNGEMKTCGWTNQQQGANSMR